MNLLYLESGALKVGRVLKEAGSSYQVQSQFGKKIKVKANHVFFFFDHADPDEFFNSSQELAETIDPDLIILSALKSIREYLTVPLVEFKTFKPFTDNVSLDEKEILAFKINFSKLEG